MGWGGDRVGDRRGWDGGEGFTTVRDWDFFLLVVVKGREMRVSLSLGAWCDGQERKVSWP